MNSSFMNIVKSLPLSRLNGNLVLPRRDAFGDHCDRISSHWLSTIPKVAALRRWISMFQNCAPVQYTNDCINNPGLTENFSTMLCSLDYGVNSNGSLCNIFRST